MTKGNYWGKVMNMQRESLERLDRHRRDVL